LNGFLDLPSRNPNFTGFRACERWWTVVHGHKSGDKNRVGVIPQIRTRTISEVLSCVLHMTSKILPLRRKWTCARSCRVVSGDAWATVCKQAIPARMNESAAMTGAFRCWNALGLFRPALDSGQAGAIDSRSEKQPWEHPANSAITAIHNLNADLLISHSTKNQ